MSHGIDKQKIIIAGGGTGGHIYPGVAIAKAVMELRPGSEVHFVGATGGLEEKIVPREGFPLHLVPVGRLHRSIGRLEQLKTLWRMPRAIWVAWRILRKIDPDVVLGVGGFASGPVLFLASLAGYRTLIWEPNAVPGWTNRLLARWVDECLLVFKEAGGHLQARRMSSTGVPIRANMIPAPRENGEHPLRVLIFGGSQGARFINRLAVESFKLGGWLDGVEVVHQTGPADFAKVQEGYAGADPESFQVLEYIHDMERRLAWADLVVCRSGASTVAEICACEKAAIFIPLPTAADDHQTKNAAVLVDHDAAMLLKQTEVTPEEFRAAIARFRDHRELIEKMERNVKAFHFPRAAEHIAERLLEGETS